MTDSQNSDQEEFIRDPVIAWLIIKQEKKESEQNEQIVYTQPVIAPQTVAPGTDPFENLSTRVGPNEEIIEVVPDTTGAAEIATPINDEIEVVGFEFANISTVSPQDMRKAFIESLQKIQEENGE